MIARLFNLAILAVCFLLTEASITKREAPGAIIQASQTPYHNSKPGIQLQSGSITYLLPGSIGDLVVKEGILEEIKFAVPAIIRKTVKALGEVAIAVLTVVTIGATLATVVLITGFFLCEFTKFCFLPSIKLSGLSNDNLEEVVRAYMTPDKLTALSNFVANSIKKFSKKHKYNKQT